MEPRDLDVLACPACGGGLRIEGAETLVCGACGGRFPIVRGIPRLVAGWGGQAGTAESFGYQWTEQAGGGFEAGTIYGESAAEELGTCLARLGVTRERGLAGRRVLDAGCGSGRLTASLADLGPELVVGLDLSASVEVAARRVAGRTNAAIVQGDILNCPLRPGSFDLVWSEGVIHHTPDAHAAFLRLARLLRPGGAIYVWLYPATFNIYRWVRDRVPFRSRLSLGARRALCRVLAVPIWAAGLAATLAGRARRRRYREVVFSLFDNLSPPYQSRHRVEEVAAWFAEAGLVGVEPRGPVVGVYGERPQQP